MINKFYDPHPGAEMFKKQNMQHPPRVVRKILYFIAPNFQ